MKSFIFTVLFLLLSFPAFSDEVCPLKGTWKSNEAATLEDMGKANLTQQQIDVFSNNMFGKMVVVDTCGEVASTYEGVTYREKYKVKEQHEDYIVFEMFDMEGNYKETTKVELRGDCYLIPIGNVGFSEFFCRVK